MFGDGAVREVYSEGAGRCFLFYHSAGNCKINDLLFPLDRGGVLITPQGDTLFFFSRNGLTSELTAPKLDVQESVSVAHLCWFENSKTKSQNTSESV